MKEADDIGGPVTGTVGGGAGSAPPADYELLLPEGWFRVHIDPESRERSVDALIDRRFAGVDNAPHVKRRLREDLLAQATAAFREGASSCTSASSRQARSPFPPRFWSRCCSPDRVGAGRPRRASQTASPLTPRSTPRSSSLPRALPSARAGRPGSRTSPLPPACREALTTPSLLSRWTTKFRCPEPRHTCC